VTVSAAEFFAGIHGSGLLPGYLPIFTLPTARTSWVNAGDWQAAEDVAVHAAADGQDVYFGVALQDRDAAIQAATNGRPPEPEKVRGGNATALLLPAVHAEIDCISPGKPSGVPTIDEALEELRALPLVPSIINFSGWGLHPYWTLREAADLTDAGTREEAARTLLGWQAFLRKRWAECGWSLDKTHTLDRILRVPGTTNRKYGQARAVRVDLFEPDRRLNLSDFEPFLILHAPKDSTPGENWQALNPIAAEAVAAVEFDVAVRAMKNGTSRHGSALSFACQLRDGRVPREITEERMHALLRVAHSLPGREIPDHEFQKTVRDAYEAEPRSPSDRAKKAKETAEPNPPEAAGTDTGRAVPIIRLCDALLEERPEPEWTIPGLLPKGGIGGLSGHGGVGKTTFLRQIAFEVAKGLPVLDTFPALSPAPVLLLTVEGSVDFNLGRFRTYLRNASLNTDDVDLFMNWDAYRPGLDGLRAYVESCKAELVILDTGRRFTSDMDENSSKEVFEKLIRPLDMLRLETGASLIFTQHLRKPAPGAPTDRHSIRGSTAFTDDVDASLILVAPEKGSPIRLLQFEKLRFGADRPPLSLVYHDDRALFRVETESDAKRHEDRRFDQKAGDVLGVLTPNWISVRDVAGLAHIRFEIAVAVLARLASEKGPVDHRTAKSSAGRLRDEYRKRAS
jgi:hypothetical protein